MLEYLSDSDFLFMIILNLLFLFLSFLLFSNKIEEVGTKAENMKEAYQGIIDAAGIASLE